MPKIIKSRATTWTITRRTWFLLGSYPFEKKSLGNETEFSIANLINKSNKFEDIYYNIGEELREFENVRIYPEQRIQKLDKTDDMRPAHDRGKEKQHDNNRRISKKLRFLSR